MNYKDIINACILSGVFLLHSPSALADTPSVGVSKGLESLQPAAEGNLWQRLIRNISLVWDSPNQELYIPVNTWHNRWTYDDEKIASYNERPWGIGYGKSTAMMKITIGILSMRWHLWILTIESNQFWVMAIRRCGYQGRGRGGVWGRVLLPVSLHAMNIVIFPFRCLCLLSQLNIIDSPYKPPTFPALIIMGTCCLPGFAGNFN